MSVRRSMADARRFPRLGLPFALVGAAGGFLSVELLSSPRINAVPRNVQPVAVIAGAIIAAIVGVIARKMCVGRKYAYVLDEPDAMARASSDRDGAHTIVVLVAGALVGALVGAACNCSYAVPLGAIGGLASSIVFLPVVIAVLRSARNAQRARLGTLVAQADRRAVWSVLATALALTTLEAVPDWLAGRAAFVAVGIVIIALLIVGLAGLADLGARDIVLRQAAHDLASAVPSFADEAPTIDLGLGDDVAARVARGRTAYRDRDRAIALVRGDLSEVRQALTRAVGRTRVSTALVSAVLSAHTIAALLGR